MRFRSNSLKNQKSLGGIVDENSDPELGNSYGGMEK